jgi:SAM-dependent methyltransferase
MGSLLDVGCGEGYTLSFFRKLGWKVKGLDYSRSGIESKNPECCEALITGDVFRLIEQENISKNQYDVIWLQNVLEHVIDPIRLLDSLRSIVSPKGMLLVTVPNDFSDIQLSALDGGHIDSEFWVALPDHLSYFSRESLKNIGSATGWSCVEILSDFPIDWFLYHPGSNYVRERSAGKPAHYARVHIENLINSRPVDDVVNFWSSLAKIGMGRDLTAFFQPFS